MEFACIGDSITDYYQTAFAAKLLPASGANVNLKVSGEETPALLIRFPAAVSERSPLFSYVVIMEGVNDVNVSSRSADDIQANLQACYTLAHNAGIQVVAMTMTPIGNAAGMTAGKQAILDAVNSWILNDAVNVDYRVDTYTALEDPGTPDQMLAAYDSGDHVHQSAAGGAVIADVLFAALGL